jgi:hypothetical protein
MTGNNLPPGVSISDSDAPWNGPGVAKYFPAECDCGFVASNVQEMEDHEHPADSFSRR